MRAQLLGVFTPFAFKSYLALPLVRFIGLLADVFTLLAYPLSARLYALA